MSEDPTCAFDSCTKTATKESLVSSADQTYSRAFCEEHLRSGTDALTNEVAALGKPPRAWDTRLTGAGLREKEEADRKLREEAEKRQREYALDRFFTYGWEDYRTASIGGTVKGAKLARWDTIDQETASKQYRKGRDDAKRKEEEQGRVIFLLSELRTMMDTADEWYGTDFDKPMALVERVIELIQEKEGNGEQSE